MEDWHLHTDIPEVEELVDIGLCGDDKLDGVNKDVEKLEDKGKWRIEQLTTVWKLLMREMDAALPSWSVFFSLH